MLHIDRERCTGCLCCVGGCPYGALAPQEGTVAVNDCCVGCGACLDCCPAGALSLPGGPVVKPAKTNDPARWQGVFVLLQLQRGGSLHPVSLELLHKAAELAAPQNAPVYAGVMGADCAQVAGLLAGRGVAKLLVAQGEDYRFFRCDSYAQAAIAMLERCHPAIALYGATPEGRLVAPLTAVHFSTGLTADCTALELCPDGGLRQIRPAFGGNVMASIITPQARPQMATVRPRVLPAGAAVGETPPIVEQIRLTPAPSVFTILEQIPHQAAQDISDCQVLVAIGKGVAAKEDIPLFEALAHKLGGQLASSRALVEKGWMPPHRQIGLSGRSVRPRLLLACGISGSVQFMAGAAGAHYLCAINQDANARIMDYAHCCVVGDMYELVPKLLEQL